MSSTCGRTAAGCARVKAGRYRTPFGIWVAGRSRVSRLPAAAARPLRRLLRAVERVSRTRRGGDGRCAAGVARGERRPSRRRRHRGAARRPRHGAARPGRPRPGDRRRQLHRHDARPAGPLRPGPGPLRRRRPARDARRRDAARRVDQRTTLRRDGDARRLLRRPRASPEAGAGHPAGPRRAAGLRRAPAVRALHPSLHRRGPRPHLARTGRRPPASSTRRASARSDGRPRSTSA